MKILIIVMMNLISVATFAQGQLSAVSGHVTINSKDAAKGDAFKIGDEIATKEASFAVLKLTDGSSIKLDQNSLFVVESMESKGRPTTTFLKLGSAFAKVQKHDQVSDAPKFILKTKAVTMGVRGTTFFASLGKEKSSDVWMCVNEGVVGIKSNEEAQEKLVKKGEGVKVLDGKKTSKPAPLPWTKKLNWEFEASKDSELENKVNIEDAYKNPMSFYYD